MTEFERFVEVVRELRSDHGCPWDKEQTHTSLRRYCIEEAAEVIAGVDILDKTGNADNLCEELGDLLLQIVLQAQIAEEEGLFNIDDVIRSISDKMVRRHPHVFNEDVKFETMEEINQTWDAIKQQEKAGHEWMDEYLPVAFTESVEMIELARQRKEEKIKLRRQAGRTLQTRQEKQRHDLS